MRIFEGWAVKYPYFGDCVTKRLNLLEYIIFDYILYLCHHEIRMSLAQGSGYWR